MKRQEEEMLRSVLFFVALMFPRLRTLSGKTGQGGTGCFAIFD